MNIIRDLITRMNIIKARFRFITLILLLTLIISTSPTQLIIVQKDKR